MKTRTWVILGVVLATVVVCAPSATSKYNTIVSIDEKWGRQNGQLNNVMQRQADLLPNMAQTAQAYLTGEQKAYIGVAAARAGQAVQDAKAASADAKTPAQQADAAQKQATAVVASQQAMLAIHQVRESYPELKANKNFETLMTELEGSQNRITTERRVLQMLTENYNVEVRYFPGTIYAKLFGFFPKQYFEADPSAQKAPDLGKVFGK